ncbi:MAG: MBL fold metallo-hydrolase [Tepidiformaceae bacterium]
MATIERLRMAYNNVYLVRQNGRLVVVDTGPDYRGAREELTTALHGATPELVVATHGHLDHAGLGRWWQSRGVPVAVGLDDEPAVRGETDHDIGRMAAYVGSIGAPSDVEAGALAGLQQRRAALRAMREPGDWPAATAGRWPSGLRYETFSPERTIAAREELPCGLTAIPTPGHTPGNLVLVHEADGWLFSGDQLLPEITPTPAIQFHRGERFASLPRFLDSLRLLQSIETNLHTCYPGHGEPFERPEGEIEANLALAEQRTERVLELFASEGPGTLYNVAERMYPRALRRRFWPIIATVQGHLDVLAEAGKATCEEGVWSA